MNEEDELQELLGSVEVTYRISPIKKVNHHVGHVAALLGAEEDDTVIWCECGWAMRFDKLQTLKDVEKLFVGHVQPSLENVHG